MLRKNTERVVVIDHRNHRQEVASATDLIALPVQDTSHAAQLPRTITRQCEKSLLNARFNFHQLVRLLDFAIFRHEQSKIRSRPPLAFRPALQQLHPARGTHKSMHGIVKGNRKQDAQNDAEETFKKPIRKGHRGYSIQVKS